MRILLLFMCCITATLLVCCSSSGPSGPQQAGEKYEGRPETRKVEGASAAGYDGVAVRKSVDNALNKNDSHNQDLDKAP